MAYADTNITVQHGRLTRDAKLETLANANGTAKLTFSIAVNRTIKTKDGYKESVSYFDYKMFGPRAASLHKFLTKGKEVNLTSELVQERYEKDGKKEMRYVFMVQSIELLDHTDKTNAKPEEVETPPVGPAPAEEQVESTEDVPF